MHTAVCRARFVVIALIAVLATAASANPQLDLAARPAPLEPRPAAVVLPQDPLVPPAPPAVATPETELPDPAIPGDESEFGVDAATTPPIDGPKLRGSDEIWLVSTRQLGCPDWKASSHLELEVRRYLGDCQWVDSTLDELLAGDPWLTTFIYIHGNRVSADDAYDRGWLAYDALVGEHPLGPLRFVIWSWSSDQIRGQVRDVRVKAAQTDSEAHYLGWFLTQLDPQTPVSLLGYSFGARIITGSLHLLGGGTLLGQSLPGGPGAGPSGFRIILIEAALHNYWLSDGAYHGRAWTLIDQMLIVYNCCDPVLKRYRLIEKGGRPAALGFTGLWVEAELEGRVEQFNACCLVGKTHREGAYIASPGVIDEVRPLVY